MAKTITVPDLGQRPEIRIVINNKEYRLTPGATVEVPDEIAATIDNIIALQPKEREPEPEPTPGPVLPEKGLVFEDYDEDGYPHKCEFVGDWTQMPNGAFRTPVSSLFSRIDDIIVPQGVTSIANYFIYESNIPKRIALPEGLLRIEGSALIGLGLLELVLPSTLNYIGSYAIGGKFTEIVIPAGVQAIQSESFRSCHNLKKVVFNGNITSIGNIAFRGCPVEHYDFSNCTVIPSLYSVVSLGHASGCVIRIPAALSDTTLGEGNGWESGTNWVALTDIVWEVVA